MTRSFCRFIHHTIAASALAISAHAEKPQIEGSGAPLEHKRGADVVDLHPMIEAAYPLIIAAWRACGAGKPVLTSGRDSLDQHKSDSLHGLGPGYAVDLRGREFDERQIGCIKRTLSESLAKVAVGGHYVLLWEAPDGLKQPRAHFHLAFDDGTRSRLKAGRKA